MLFFVFYKKNKIYVGSILIVTKKIVPFFIKETIFDSYKDSFS